MSDDLRPSSGEASRLSWYEYLFLIGFCTILGLTAATLLVNLLP